MFISYMLESNNFYEFQTNFNFSCCLVNVWKGNMIHTAPHEYGSISIIRTL